MSFALTSLPLHCYLHINLCCADRVSWAGSPNLWPQLRGLWECSPQFQDDCSPMPNAVPEMHVRCAHECPLVWLWPSTHDWVARELSPWCQWWHPAGLHCQCSPGAKTWNRIPVEGIELKYAYAYLSFWVFVQDQRVLTFYFTYLTKNGFYNKLTWYLELKRVTYKDSYNYNNISVLTDQWWNKSVFIWMNWCPICHGFWLAVNLCCSKKIALKVIRTILLHVIVMCSLQRGRCHSN